MAKRNEYKKVDYPKEPVAIIGIGLRFPGESNTIDELWEHLKKGSDLVSVIPQTRWRISDYKTTASETKVQQIPSYGSFLNDIDKFDNVFFGISPREAESMDPQQRLLLEVTYHAIEDAGLKLEEISKSDVGIYLGISNSDYLTAEVKTGDLGTITPYSLTGATLCSAAGRLSYFLGCHGPSMVIDTACSSSLSALHIAVRSVQSDEVPIAFAGGVSVILTPELHIGLNEMEVLSADGKCKVFDDSANGYVRSEGCSVIVLKKLSKALENKDHIYGIILGSAVNHDGRSNGLASPNGVAQIDVMKKSLANAGLKANDIDYFEAHGTGTAIGDTQEINSISKVYNSLSKILYVGSIKSNLGHLEACAGLAGLLKILLIFKNRTIPANIHYSKPNPRIPWEKLSIQVPAENIKLSKKGLIKASINSFGFSGTNVNFILEEYNNINKVVKHDSKKSHYILNISAETNNSLKKLAEDYVYIIDDEHLKDLVYNMIEYRTDLSKRLSVYGTNAEELKHNLELYLNNRKSKQIIYSRININNLSDEVVFLFPGGGAQRLGMGMDLYESSDLFKSLMDKCDKLFEEHIGKSIINIIKNDEIQLNNIEYAQPALFALEYSLAKLWLSWGIEPAALIGHSTGEYAAACIAGVFSLEDAIKLVSNRAKLMNNLSHDGMMCAVYSDETTIKKYLDGFKNKVGIATINSSENIVISGDKKTVSKIIYDIEKDSIETKILKVSIASHSPMMEEPILEEYLKVVQTVELHEPKYLLMSNISGKPAEIRDITSCDYWIEHVKSTVRYADSLDYLINEEYRIFLEVGPSQILTGIGIQSYPDLEALWLSSFGKDTPEWEHLLLTASELFVHHIKIDWKKIFCFNSFNKIKLPFYPFDRKSFWKDPKLISKNSKTNYCELATEPTLGQQNVIRSNSIDVLSEITKIINNITGFEFSGSDSNKLIFQLGLDSLILVKLRQAIKKVFKVEVSMSGLYKEYNTLHKLSDFIEEKSEVIIFENDNKKEDLTSMTSITGSQISCNSNKDIIAYTLQEQFKIMNKQLELLGSGSKTEFKKINTITKERKIINFRSIKTDTDNILDQNQQEFIDKFIKKYNKKTKKSKEYAQNHRYYLSDWINTLSYRQDFKKLSYPFVAQKSLGSRVWDIDGNEYIDLTNGYGVHFFGHRPSFIMEAIQNQIDEGFELGPQSAIVGETALLITSITGNDRVTFCNTGSEAVMVALRLARAKTEKDKIVIFSGSYHGTFDGILAVANDEQEVQPVSIGVTGNMVKDVIVLEYGSESSLDFILQNYNNIAGVICEPVQTRKPELQPSEFLKELRRITSDKGITLIFDEVVTGFRVLKGGAQEYFNIRADIVVYGKIAGGGMPIGIVSGKKEYLDIIDGGYWNFDDNSHPQSKITFFGGTFCKHPLTMAVCNAVMKKIIADADVIYPQINSLTKDFSERLNEIFKKYNIPFVCNYFASQFKIDGIGTFSTILKPIELDLFYYLMLDKGIYFWERKINFFSTEISQSDVEKILKSAEETIIEMKSEGFFKDKDDNSIELSKKNIYPMSSSQKRIYILGQYENGEIAYHITQPFRIKGKPDFNKLESVLIEIINRHDSFKSIFYSQENQFVQEIIDTSDFKLIEIQNGSNKNINEIIDDFIQPFDFRKAPLIRAGYCKLNSNDYLFILDVHHIIIDGISLGILYNEIISLYNGNNILPVNNYGYRKFLDYENSYKSTITYFESEKYWQHKFQGELPILDLPTSNPRMLTNNFEGFQLHFQVDKELTLALKSYSMENNSTLYSVLLASFFVLLNKLSDREDIIVGTPISIREGEDDFENQIGMMTNTIALRLNPTKRKLFLDFLQEVQLEVLNSNEHIQYPLEDVISKSNIKKVQNRNPLFDVLFVFENTNERKFELENFTIERVKYIKKTTMMDLTLEVISENDLLNMSFEYDKNIFDKNIINKFSEYYHEILKSIIISNKLIADINIIPAVDMKILKSGLKFQQMRPLHNNIIDLFNETVKRFKNKTAVIFNKMSYSYKELDVKSDLIAINILENFDIHKGEIIALYMNRSFDLTASLFAVLKLGLAYLPIDVNYPESRIKYLIEDSNTRLVITESEINWHNAFINVNSLKPSSKELQKTDILNDDLAYLYYTSGSTGNPKGVMITHYNLLSFNINMKETFGIQSDDIIYALTPITFDISNLEILCSLLNGMTVALGSEEEINNLDLFLSELNNHHVNTLQITPSRLELIINEKGTDFLKNLKTLLVGGEELNKSLYEKLISCVNNNTFNVYGPTETTIWSTAKRLTHDSNSIGQPLINESVFVLDDEGNILPLYKSGEIYIGGDGVAKGYWNNEELNKLKFISNPFIEGKLYKTGDIGRINGNLEIEFLGRNDNQIKINGLRIELNEIEYICNNFSGIESSVCILKEQNNTRYLVLYLTGLNIKIDDLKLFMKKKLPNYMVPNYIEILDKLPLTHNGKVDRLKLQNNTIELVSSKNQEYPSNQNEELIIRLIEELLNNQNISITDNFFEIGGDSIKAIQLITLLYKENIRIELKDVLQNPVLRDMVNFFKIRKKSKPITKKLNITALQEAIYLNSIETDGRLYHEQLLFELNGDLDVLQFEKAWQFLIQLYEILRTNFVSNNFGEVFQDISDHIDFKINYREIRKDINEIRDDLLKEDVQHKFNLSDDELIRVYLIKYDEKKWIVLFSFHHIILDGWSLGVLFNSLKEIYHSLINANEISETKVLQFSDFSTWLTQKDNNEDKEFWKLYLKDVSDNKLPFPINTTMNRTISEYSISFNSTEQRKINEFIHSNKVTLNSVLSSAWGIGLSEYFNQKDITFGVVFSGRQATLENIENSLGLFINTLPIRVKTSNNSTISETIKNIHSDFINIIPHSYYPLTNILSDNNIKNTLINHVLVIENYNSTDLNLGENLKVENISFFENTEFSLVIYFEISNEIKIKASFNSEIVSTIMIKELLDNYRELLTEKIFDQYYIVNNTDASSVIACQRKTISKTIYQEEHTNIVNGTNTALAEIIKEIFSKVLNKNSIELTSDFFDNGGQSLKVIKLISSIYKHTGIKLVLQDIIDNPTVNKLTDYISTKKNDNSANLEKVATMENYNLSFAQKRLWLIHDSVGASPAYNVWGSLILRGDVNINYLNQAILIMFNRRDAFKTYFKKVKGEPKQFIATELDYNIGTIDFSNENEPFSKANEYIYENSKTSFDITQAPLVKVSLLFLGILDNKRTYIFYFNTHHIIFDGWSNELLLNELSLIYKSLLNSEEMNLTATPYNYVDYSEWQIKQYEAGYYEQSRDFWLRKLDNCSFKFSLNSDFPRQIKKISDCKTHTLLFEEESVSLFKSITFENRISLFSFITGSIYLMLYIESGNNDIITGIPLSGREIPMLENIIGYFINTMPLRINIDSNMTIRNLLINIHNELSQLNKHQSYPFEKLLEELNISYDNSRHPMFDIIINSYDSDLNDLVLEGVEVSTYIQEPLYSKFDIQFYYEESDKIKLNIEYNSELFMDETIKRFSDEIRKISNYIINEPEKQIFDLKSILKSENELIEEFKFKESTNNINEEF
jgi:amino acid adenylation domain-containing protein